MLRKTALLLLSLVLLSQLAATAGADVAVLPAPADRGPGLLFHASFDTDRRADFAVGPDLPVRGRYAHENRTAEGGEIVPGKFGNALTGGRSLGSYAAPGNASPYRGTIAFFIRYENKPYGFEPFVLSSVDNYYWLRYIRAQIKPGGSLITSIANEIYRPQSLGRTEASTPHLTEGTWHHIAIAYDHTQGFSSYVDGRLYASNWGEHHWLAHGVDTDSFWIRPDADVAYDELYVFDRALSAEQIRALAERNERPAEGELPPLSFDDDDVANRLRELSWTTPDAAMPRLTLTAADEADGNKPLAVRQVVPRQARAVMNEANIAFDGKLGGGFPALYGYKYANGNGLHVELPEPFDYALIEGHFTGEVYSPRTLLRPAEVPEHASAADLLETFGGASPPSFITRWTLDTPHPAGWLSFFRVPLEDASDVPDKEQVILGRINELSFYQLGTHTLAEATAQRYSLGAASLEPGAELGEALTGDFTPGDRAVLTVTSQDADTATAQPQAQHLPALRYHHILVPASDRQRIVSGLRLKLWLADASTFNADAPAAMRLELRDPLLPARRLAAVDLALAPAAQPAHGPQLLDFILDISDRVVPAGKPLWLQLVFRHDVTLLLDAAGGRGSHVDVLTGDRETAVSEHIAMDMPLVLARFAELASPRPWGPYDHPEVELPKHYQLAAELMLPLALIRELAPDHATAKALWAWTHKNTVDTSPVEAAPVAGHVDAPRWALLQRELRNRCREVFLWWIDHRQAPTGEFGDDLNDDTDFMQDMAKYTMIHDPGDRLREAILDVARACIEQGAVTAGLNTTPTDPLHAYENGTNVLAAATLVAHDDPLHRERLMEAFRTIRDRLTGRDVHGRLRFISNYYGYNEVRTEGNYGADSQTNALMVHPALLLAYLSGSPEALGFAADYARGWMAYWDESPAPNKLASGTLMDGTVTRYDHRIRGYGMSSLFLGAWKMTGDDRFRDSGLARWNQPEHARFRGGDSLAALEAIDLRDYPEQVTAWANAADLAHVTVDRFGHVARQRYAAFEATGDEAAAYEALEASLRNIRLLFDAYTQGEPQNDRIWPPDSVATIMALGGVPHERNQLFPRHYVSYEGFSDLTAWVREKSESKLVIWLYNFSQGPEAGLVRFWRNPHGRYDIQLRTAGEDDTLGEVIYETHATLHRGAGVELELPPGKFVVLEVTQTEPLSEEAYWSRPDAAIGTGDIQRGDNGRLHVTVHNLGNGVLENLDVSLIDAAGNVTARATVEKLEAPLDMHPRAIAVTFSRDDAADAVAVALDGAEAVAEQNELNNRREIHAR